MKTEFKIYNHIALALIKLLYPFAEVVIHNFKKDNIEAIYNSFSKREIGDNSYIDFLELDLISDQEIIGPYEKINYDGRKLKSISIVIRNELEEAIGLLCINIDISVFEQYRDLLQNFLSYEVETKEETKQKIFKNDLYEQINCFIHNYCKIKHLNVSYLTKNEKQDIILALKERGAFKGVNATSYISRILGISRATVYNYVNKI